MRTSFRCAWLIAATVVQIHAGPVSIISAGSVWKYLDTGTNPGPTVRWPIYNDTDWLQGAAQFGYNDGDEETVVWFGPDEDQKFITTYFRKHFVIIGAHTINTLTLRLLRDDGALVYLNGSEVFRNNMPPFPLGIDYVTPASRELEAPEESEFVETQLNPRFLLEGENLIVVEVHQASRTSDDLSFDLELIADTGAGTSAVQIARGPYLQSATPTNLLVRWRTSAATNAVVRWGTSPELLSFSATNLEITTEHIVAVTNLQPETKYWYSVGTTDTNLAAGADYCFITAPLVGTPKRTRIWAIGDSGTASTIARGVRDAYYNFAGTNYTDLWLMLGDNAYGSGFDSEYQAAVFNTYPTMLRQTVLWPALGNHETYNNQTPLPYFNIFSLPTDGRAGGVPSGTEAYYSYDYANIHFIVLDSMTSDRSSNGPMATWLTADLENTAQEWIIAYWHHPPYTKGTHNSDTERELIDMRERLVPILEDYGVDLVLCGHSHNYERSFLIDGHYGRSSTFGPQHLIDGGDGRLESNGAYLRPAGGLGSRRGTVYTVAGCSGGAARGWQFDYPHKVMFYWALTYGSLVIDVHSNRLDVAFLSSSQTVDDHFTIIKGDFPGMPAPWLRAAGHPQGMKLTWPISTSDYQLESATNISELTWNELNAPIATNGHRKSTVVPVSESAEFFRLRKQP